MKKLKPIFHSNKRTQEGFGVIKIIIAVFIVFIALYIVMRVFVFDFFVVQGLGMEPTIERDEWVLLKIYGDDYKRGDIIVFKDPQFNENSFKRIVGLPGEKIKIVDDFVFINGQRLDESQYLLSGTKTPRDIELILKENEYFVLGDNRENSVDSREFGAVKKEAILGRYWLSLPDFKNKLSDKEWFIAQEKQNQLITSQFKRERDGQLQGETADWQTYRNEKYGFEVQYPIGYDVNFFDHLLADYSLDPQYSYLDPLYFSFAGLNLKKKDDPYYKVEYRIGILHASSDVESQLRRKIYFVDSQTGICNDEIKSVKINEMDAFHVSYLVPFQTKIDEVTKNYEKYCDGNTKNILWAVFEHNNKLYEISWFAPYYFSNENELTGKEDYKLYNQILSTFKFYR